MHAYCSCGLNKFTNSENLSATTVNHKKCSKQINRKETPRQTFTAVITQVLKIKIKGNRVTSQNYQRLEDRRVQIEVPKNYNFLEIHHCF